MSFLYHNPVHPIKQRESYKMFLYKELLLTLTKEQPHVYSKQTRRYHLAGMLCEMMANLNKMVPDEKRKDINHNRAIVITRSFLELVNADDGSHRSVCYYADRLCYSPKYLSFIIKTVTGKTPLQIINEHAIKQIKVKLRYTDISMKELADLFDFPNPSFFGKFVKMHTGMSPMQYRQSKEEV
jgi:AraC-like DNA-binding protein